MESALMFMLLLTAVEISCYKLLALENFTYLYIVDATLYKVENKSADNKTIESPTKPKPYENINTFLGKHETINIFDYHFREQYIFYSGNNINGLMRLSFRSKDAKRERIVKRPDIIDIAVDWVQDKVYWTDRSEIHSVDLDGSNDKLVVSLSSVKNFTGKTIERFDHITIDPFERILFFTVVVDEDGKRKAVFKSDLQGYYPNEIRQYYKNESVQYMTLDLEKSKLYLQVLEHKQTHVIETHYNGANIIEFRSDDLNMEFPFQFFKDTLFFVYENRTEQEVYFYEETPSSNGSLHNIKRGPKSMRNFTVNALRVYEQDAQLSRERFYLRKCGSMKCDKDKCTVLPVAGAFCDCDGGEGLLEDMKTCHKNYVYKIVSSNDTTTRYGLGNCTFKINNAKATDYYFSKGYMFYYMNNTKKIYRQKCQESAFEIQDNVANVLGLAVDSVHDVIYWVDLPAGQLYRSDTEGQNIYRWPFITDLKPRASIDDIDLYSEYYGNHLVVDPQKEYVFAALILNNGTFLISRVHLRHIEPPKVTNGLGKITSIAIDVELATIYYAIIIDEQVIVNKCNYEFGELISYNVSEEFGTIISISALNGMVRCIGYNPQTGDSILLDCTQGQRLESLDASVKMYKMVSALQQASIKDLKCLEKHCSHICLDNATCACPENHSLFMAKCYPDVKSNSTDQEKERPDSPQALKVMVIIAVAIILIVVGVSVFMFPWRDDFDSDGNETLELR